MAAPRHSPAAGTARAPGVAMWRRLAASLALAALAGAAPAQVTGIGDYLAKMDADGDGRVSLAEYQDWMSYAFDAMDADGDGVLSPSEQPGGKGRPIGRDDHRARLADRFRRQDLDRNGFLDARELSAPPQ